MKALIAMSGGVDSSVAAYLMKEYDRIGCTMRLFENEEEKQSSPNSCCSLEDVDDARAVCQRLSIPYYVFNFKEDFEEKIIARFISSYRRGKTPNPCIDCNKYMKFEKLMQRADELLCDLIVTGHYARVEKDGEKYLLKKAKDPSKDQSYVLYSLTQEQLRRIRFPLGEYTKDEVRKIAEENGFVNAHKKDSQDICFVPDGDYASFIEKHTGKVQTGDFLLSSGEKVGEHKGIVHYTVGQRKHLGIALGRPIFVTKVDAEHNIVYLGDNDELYSGECIAQHFNWTLGEAPDSKVVCTVKTRYRQKEVGAVAYPLEDGSVRIVFDTPIRAVTPGQAAVLYDGDIVLGGGEIV